MTAYYNEIEPFAVEWLRNLIDANLIAPGDVDDRSIVDVQPSDLKGYTQCHFFAGIGVWSYALRAAGWPDDRQVWTGSAPCQPFSVAGLQLGKDDPRHLAPHWLELISQRGPDVIFGEQVDAAIRKGWLDDLQVHLEAENYAVGAIVFPACSVGAPHIRQRLYFAAERLADTDNRRPQGWWEPGRECPAERSARARRLVSGLADAKLNEQRERGGSGGEDQARDESGFESGRCSPVGGMEHTGSGRRERRETTTSGNQHDRQTSDRPQSEYGACESGPYRIQQPAERPGPVNGFWRAADWLGCRDGKFRPVEPGTFPLVDGAAGRVGRLRAYGNAIVAEQAKAFIEAFMECRP